ncbi:hypothetical protein HN011_011118 [Eciton burchellii]|nr:hypothetical protein HN011_011118 [Eciton burchellii]
MIRSKMSSQVNQEWTSLELAELLEDEDSRVCFKRTTKHYMLHPSQLNNVEKALKDDFCSQNVYDMDLEGFILDFKEPKLFIDSGHLDNTCLAHIHIKADFYLFQPRNGCILKGIVNKKGTDHILVLIHKLFTVTILKPYKTENWVGNSVEVGQQVRCHIKEINIWDKPPFFRGALESDYLKGCKLPESIINANDTLITIKSKELANKKLSSNHTILNEHIQKKSEETFTNSDTDSIFKIIDEKNIIKDVSNFPVKKKKKTDQKHVKSEDSDLECTFKIKKQEEKDIDNVNNIPDERKKTNAKKRTRISNDFDTELELKIKKKKNIISDTTNSPIKEMEKNSENHIKISRNLDAKSVTSKIDSKNDIINDVNDTSGKEKKISKKHTKSIDSNLEYAFGIKKEKDVNKEQIEIDSKQSAKISSKSNPKFEIKIKKEKDTISIDDNNSIKEIEKNSKKDKKSRDSNFEPIFKIKKEKDLIDVNDTSDEDKKISKKRAGISNESDTEFRIKIKKEKNTINTIKSDSIKEIEKSSKKDKKSRDSNLEFTFKIKKEKDLIDVNDTSDEERKNLNKRARISNESNPELEIKIKKERIS